jgi:hypothetical protein
MGFNSAFKGLKLVWENCVADGQIEKKRQVDNKRGGKEGQAKRMKKKMGKNPEKCERQKNVRKEKERVKRNKIRK